MEDCENLLAAIDLNEFEVGTLYWVDVTHIDNPHSFYCRPRAYNKFLKPLMPHGKHIEASKITIGNNVLYKSKKMESYIRGEVRSVESLRNKPSFKILAIDYGFIESDLRARRIWDEDCLNKEVPPLALHCQLAKCTPLGGVWDETATKAMYEYIEGLKAKMVIKGFKDKQLVVDLYNCSLDNIATLLALTGFSTLGYVEPSIANRRINF